MPKKNLLILFTAIFFHSFAESLRVLHFATSECPCTCNFVREHYRCNSSCIRESCPRPSFPGTPPVRCCPTARPSPSPASPVVVAKRNIDIIDETAEDAVRTDRELSIRLARILFVAIQRIEALGATEPRYSLRTVFKKGNDFGFARFAFRIFTRATISIITFIYSKLIQFL